MYAKRNIHLMYFTWIDAILKIKDGRHDQMFFFRGYPLNMIVYT